MRETEGVSRKQSCGAGTGRKVNIWSVEFFSDPQKKEGKKERNYQRETQRRWTEHVRTYQLPTYTIRFSVELHPHFGWLSSARSGHDTRPYEPQEPT